MESGTTVAERLQAGWRLHQAGDVAAGEAEYRSVLRDDPASPEAWCYLGIACYDQRRLDEAVGAYRRAIELRAEFPIAWNNLGNALRRAGLPTDAIAALRQAIALKPDYASAHNNLGVTLLSTGDFAGGWPEYEWRRRCFRMPEPSYPQPRWDGSSLAGRTLLLYAEQGLGDTLQFARYAGPLSRDGGRMILWAQRPLLPLLRTCPGVAELMTHGDPLPRFDAHASLLSVPALLRTNEATMPRDVPYLFADQALRNAWRARLDAAYSRKSKSLDSPGRVLRVGIAWQGNPDHPADVDRSISLAQFASLAALDNVRLFGLQKNAGREQIQPLRDRVPLVDLGPELDEQAGPFLDTAAVMCELDVVVTSDTSIAHLAGALGVPVWVVLSAAPDWRWMLNREDSPWYPTMRLFRQRTLGDWTEVFARVAGELRRVASGERSLSADSPSSGRLSAVPTSAGMRQIKENPSAPRSSGASTNSLAPSPSSSHSHGSPITNAMTTVAQALTQAWQIHQSGDIASAENIYRQVLSAQPESANGWCYLGIACHDLDRFEEAESAYREALRLQPEFPVALNNMGNTLRRLGRIDEALASFRRALELKPDYLNAFKNAGTTLVWEGRFDEAIDWYSQALRLNPDEAESHRNVGIIRLLQGDFTNGWPEYEWRWRADDLKKPPHAQPEWQGESLDGKTILLYAEQGLGDTLNFVRYANVLKQLGARTIVQVQPPLVPLLRSTPGIDTLVPQREQPPAFDVHAPLLSVPAILKTDLDSIPADVPYVFADERLIEFWRSELRSFGGLRVGIVWQGNPDHQADHLRSVPLTRFAPLAALPGVQLFSLQKGHGAEQLAGAGANINVVNLGARLDESSGAFLDTAAVMKVLDLVITTDTSIAHLAGALGVPTWLALPYVPDWRWLLDREDSPWYPTMRLFRQTQPGDWDGVFERLTEALRQQADAKAAPPLPDGASAGAAESTAEASADSAASALPNTSASPTAVRHEEEPATLARHTTLAGFNDLVRARYGVMLYNRHDRYIGRSLNLYGEFSEGEVDLFRAMLKPGDVVLEAGANIGVHTLPLSQLVGKKGTILAFEPQRIVFQTLCANMALNSVQNVHAHQQALGDTQGRVPVPALDYTRENNFGGLSLGRQAQGEPVPLVTIDALAVSRCNLLKVDVEGMEQQVLRGARQTIERHRPFLYVENDRAEQSAALVQLMRSFGYRLFWHTPPLFNPRNYFGNEQNVFDTIASFNVLGVHQSIRTDIQGLREVE